MPLQDIKYAMSVGDGAAQKAISRAVKDLRALDGKTLGGGVSAEHLTAAINSAGEAASGAIANMGSAIGGLFAGTALGAALGDAAGQLTSKLGPIVVAMVDEGCRGSWHTCAVGEDDVRVHVARGIQGLGVGQVCVSQICLRD